AARGAMATSYCAARAAGLPEAPPFVIHPDAMAVSDSARSVRSPGGAGRTCGAMPFLLCLLSSGACALVTGCHSGAAGGHAFDAAVETAPDVVPEAATAEVYCAPDAAGGGQCPLNFCGQPKSVATLVPGQMTELGADSICTPGTLCVPDGPTADGNAL